MISRLRADPVFLAGFERNAEEALSKNGYRLSEAECLLLSEKLIQDVVEGRASKAMLLCPCPRHRYSMSEELLGEDPETRQAV